MIHALSAVTAVNTNFLTSASDGVASNAPSGFAQMLDKQFDQVNQDVGSAEVAMQKLASGQPIEIHDVMISLEKARLSVQVMLQVRNRLLDAYQEVSRMQV